MKYIFSLIYILFTVTLNAQEFQSSKLFSRFIVNQVKIDNDGFIYKLGTFYGTVDFSTDSIPNIVNLPDIDINVFLAKYTPEGNLIWVETFGDEGREQGKGLTLDENNNIYITGSYSDSLNIGNLDPVYHTGLCAYMIKFNNDGEGQWIKSINTVGEDVGYDIIYDGNGYLYASGHFDGPFYIEIDDSLHYIESTNYPFNDGYILKMDTNGNYVWFNNITGPGNHIIANLTLDNQGHVYASGIANGNPFTSSFDETEFGSAIISKYTTDGDLVWEKTTTTVNHMAEKIEFDHYHSIYVSGFFKLNTYFDLFNETYPLHADTDRDRFLAKYDLDGNLQWVRSFSASYPRSFPYHDLLVDKAGKAYITGLYHDTFTIDTVQSPITDESGTHQDGYFIKFDREGQIEKNYFFKQESSRVYPTAMALSTDQTQLLVSVNINTSPLLLHNNTDSLNVNYIITPAKRRSILLEFNQCFHIETDSIQSCEPYEWIDENEYAYSTSNIYYPLSDNSNCDTVLQLKLEIGAGSYLLNQTDDDLTILADQGTFQWLNCANDYSIINQANQNIFSPLENGSYAVEITNNGCVDTTSCIEINNLSIPTKHSDEFEFNQLHDRIQIVLPSEEYHQIQIINQTGQTIYNQKSVSKIVTIHQHLPKGLYYITVRNQHNQMTQKMIYQ